MFVERGDVGRALDTIGHQQAGLGIGHLHNETVFVDVHAITVLALSCHGAAFVRAVTVKHRGIPEFFENGAIFHAQPDADHLDAQRTRIDTEFIARHRSGMADVSRTAEYGLDAPGLDQFDLTPCWRGGAAARHDRNRAGVLPELFAMGMTAIAQAK